MNPFVSTRAFRTGHLGAMTMSVAAHTALVVMAIVPSATSPWHAHETVGRGFPTERVHFVAVALRARSAERNTAPTSRTATKKTLNSGKRSSVASGARLIFQPLSIAPIVLADSAPLAEIDLTDKITDSLDFSRASLTDMIGTVIGVRRPPPVDGVYGAESVEKVVFALRGNPKPEYPRSLEAASIEGTFLVRFVVDSTGRVDAKAAQFPREAHPLFVDAIRRALMRSRFLPAEVDGRHVPQLVSQEFLFRMARR
jgi:TonB family protein